MVYYINESYDSKSIDQICNEFTLYVNNIIHESEISVLESKYSFICENGYEMPINEAEEQKQGFFKKMIERIKIALKNLCDKAIIKLQSYIDTHYNSKIITPAIARIRDLLKKASKKLDNAKDVDEAKDISDDTSNEVKDITDNVSDNIKKSISFKNDKPVGPGKVTAEKLYKMGKVSTPDDAIIIRDACKNLVESNKAYPAKDIDSKYPEQLEKDLNQIFDWASKDLSDKKGIIRLGVELLEIYNTKYYSICMYLEDKLSKLESYDVEYKTYNNYKSELKEISIRFEDKFRN